MTGRRGVIACMILACAWAPGPAFAFPFAFAVRGDVDDQLYRIDLATGTATPIGPVGFGDVESLAWHPHTGVLYGVDDVTNQLITINSRTGAGTLVGPLGVAITDMGLTFDGTAQLFMSTDAPLPYNFYRVNPLTGAATLVGAQGQQVTGLTWRQGVLYGLGGDNTNNLVTLNPLTGLRTVIGPLGTVNVSDGGLDFDQTGVLWGVEDLGRIFQINPATGAATLGPMTLSGFENLHVIKPVPVVTGPGAGGGPHVVARIDTDGNGSLDGTVASFLAYGAGFTGGVRVARCDVNGDGVADFVTGTGPGGGPHVRVFSGLGGGELLGFFPYDPGFTGGVFVACGDADGDGRADVVTGTGAGGGPHVRVFSGATGIQLAGAVGSFFAYSPLFTGGVTVAACDVNGDTAADIVTGTGAGGGPHVRVLDGVTGAELASFFAYDPAFTGGVFVGCGRLNGDRFADIITGTGAGGGPHVRAFDGATGAELASFFAYSPAFTGGVTVAAGDVNGDGRTDIITGTGAGGGPHVRVFDGETLVELTSFFAYDTGFTGGVFVAGGVGF